MFTVNEHSICARVQYAPLQLSNHVITMLHVGESRSNVILACMGYVEEGGIFPIIGAFSLLTAGMLANRQTPVQNPVK